MPQIMHQPGVNWDRVVTDPRKYVKMRRAIPNLPPQIISEMWQHAKRDDPNECCGAVVLTHQGQLVYMPKPNIAPVKEDKWQMSKRDQADIIASGEIICLHHSHPGGDMPFPSELDMQRQMDMDIPWAISSFGPGVIDELIWLGCGNMSLRDRGFRHGTADCFEFGRDYYLYTLGIEWKNRPRDWRWWKDKDKEGKLKSLYLENFADEGFESIGKSNHPQLHDIFLCQMRSKVPNHMMVYVGNGLVAHHPAGFAGYDLTKVSTIEPYVRWFDTHTHTMRHRSLMS